MASRSTGARGRRGDRWGARFVCTVDANGNTSVPNDTARRVALNNATGAVQRAVAGLRARRAVVVAKLPVNGSPRAVAGVA